MIADSKVEDLLVELNESMADTRRIRDYLAVEGIKLTVSSAGITWRRTAP